MKREIKYLEKSKLYSEELGIDLKTGKEREIFKWFLASILFGKPIQENVAIKTYKEFERRNVLSQEAILKVGWNGLVEILDAGGYVRYDFSTATKLLEIMKALKEKYGTLNELHKQAEDSKDLEAKLQEFKGIGVVTTNIFLRELRPFGKKPIQNLCQLLKKLQENIG
jgi:endonuclease III